MPITLAAARVNRGFSQKDAAKALNLSRDTLRNYENGKTFPNTAVIQKIEKLYGMDYKDIIFLRSNNA